MFELKPCPFCGHLPVLRAAGDKKQYIIFLCDNCGYAPVLLDETKRVKRAMKLWNKRAKEAETKNEFIAKDFSKWYDENYAEDES